MEHEVGDATNWQLLSSHARVLLAVLDDDQALRSEIAARAVVTERTVSRVINDLEEAGILIVDRSRRRNRYRLADGAAHLGRAAEVVTLSERLLPPGTDTGTPHRSPPMDRSDGGPGRTVGSDGRDPAAASAGDSPT